MKQGVNDVLCRNFAGDPAFKPPSKVVTHGKLTANDLVGKSVSLCHLISGDLVWD